MEPASLDLLLAGLDQIRRSPRESGVLERIVRRPAVDEREVIEEGRLELAEGLVGDSWARRKDRHTPDGTPNPDKQLNLMNSRAIALIAGDPERWALAGDQLFVDLDLSAENLPPGTRLAIGSAEIVVTAEPHQGCAKFSRRFGSDALKFVNKGAGRELNLRGICARVLTPGTIRTGDVIRAL